MRLVELHSAKRWGALVGLAISCSHDLTTVGAWAREAGMCETQLRLRCRLAGLSAKKSLDFARVVRAVAWQQIRGGTLQDYLNVGDTRTLRRLVTKAGLKSAERVAVLEYVNAQRVIKDVPLLEELNKIVTSSAMLSLR